MWEWNLFGPGPFNAKLSVVNQKFAFAKTKGRHDTYIGETLVQQHGDAMQKGARVRILEYKAGKKSKKGNKTYEALKIRVL